MQISVQNIKADFGELPVNAYWTNYCMKELWMHKIHVYPAKFRAFLVPKALEFAKCKGIQVKTIADIFCGCGTTALEAKRLGINFWGCDINPVATLIARVKSEQYEEQLLERYFTNMLKAYHSNNIKASDHYAQNERIRYWFYPQQINDLSRLLKVIDSLVPEEKYQAFFLCAFSNILKSTSRWLTKSIKPQVDPNKTPHDVINAFQQQFHFMLKASQQANKAFISNSNVEIVNENFLKTKKRKPFIDLLITSPPYVTSYEYADLYQLSTLWLGYADDYRSLRRGTIGSSYSFTDSEDEIHSLNATGKKIYQKMLETDPRKAKSIGKYFLDMQRAVAKTYCLLNPEALCVFIIGDTRYKDTEINNAKFIARCMLDSDFSQIEVFKRKIGPKMLTPYRDVKGRFSGSPTKRKVYNHEFLVIGRK